MTSGDIDLFN